MTEQISSRFGLTLAMIACVGVYIFGLFGGFLFDDFPNIVDNPVLRAVEGGRGHWYLAALSSDAGILHRPISMLSFAANIFLFGMSPLAFKIVNLLIHLGNGLLLYRLSLLLCRFLRPGADAAATSKDVSLSLFVCTAWLLHPLHVSDVVYIVQRMNLLSTLFTLAGLCGYAEGRTRMLAGRSGLALALSSLCAFGVLALLCKENGALVVAYAFVIETVCFRFRGDGQRSRKAIVWLFVLGLALPLALLTTYLLWNPAWLINGYAGRDFTLGERLLTEPRILLYYLRWIFLPLPSSLGLYHDDIALSSGWFLPATTVIAIILWSGTLCIAWLVRRRVPALTFGIAWFLAGHAMESTILPLEIVFEHRNYLPSAGLMLGIALAIEPLLRRAAAPTGALAVLGLAFVTAQSAYAWGDPIRLARTNAENHPDSPRALYDAGRALIHEADARDAIDSAVRRRARTYFMRAMELAPSDVYSPISAILTYAGDGKPPEQLIASLESRLRMTRGFLAAPLRMLLKALGDGYVLLDARDVERLVTAALDNPHLNSDNKAALLNAFGRYQFTILHDTRGAVSLTLAAVEMSPRNPLLRLDLAKLALALGQHERAAQALSQAKVLDRAGIYADEIQGIEHELRSNTAPHV